MNENIQEYMRPDVELFNEAADQIAEFDKNFKLTEVVTK